MFITDENKALAARKHALAFHTRHGIKSIAEIKPHTLTWADLNAVEKDARKEASAMLDRTPASTDEQRASLESAVDGFSDLLEAIRAEKDERSITGSKEPRAESATEAQRAKRPGYDAGEVRQGDEGTGDTVYALAPEQRFTTWA